MTAATGFPYLELGPADPDFDEAVILINGHEEETIRIECSGAHELAERLVWLVNNFHTILTKPGDAVPSRTAVALALMKLSRGVP